MDNYSAKEALFNLMDLLDEQDEPVFDKISESIQSFGVYALPFLESTRDNTLNGIVQSRVKELIHKIKFQNLYFELHNWASFRSKDLLRGYLLISRYLFPELDEARVANQIEVLKQKVWLELKMNMTPFEEATVLSRVLFDLEGYAMNSDAECFPESLCINTLLDERKGFPVALSVLYAGLAQRMGFPIYGVNMPESMFLAYVYAPQSHRIDYHKDVVFYINPLKAGMFFTNLDIKEYLEKNYPREQRNYTGACDNTQLILQLVKMMQYAFVNSNQPQKVDELRILMEALNTV